MGSTRAFDQRKIALILDSEAAKVSDSKEDENAIETVKTQIAEFKRHAPGSER